MALQTTINTGISASLTGVATDLQTAPSSGLGYAKTFQLTTGTGINQADVIYTDQITIGDGATLDLDIATGGGLTDALGVAVAMVKLKYLYVHALPANTTIVTLERETAGVPFFDAVGDAMPIVPGGKFEGFWPSAAAIAVTAATADLITLVNAAGAAAVVDVIIVGTSA